MSAPTKITLSAAEAVERVAVKFAAPGPECWPHLASEKARVYAALASGGTFILGRTVSLDGTCKCPAYAAGIERNRATALGLDVDAAFLDLGVCTGTETRLTVTV